jgi:DNA polymerase-3 subunit delta'
MSASPLLGPGTVGGVDVWADVVGQEPAVAQLRAAAVNPVHAYLLVGPEGAGKRAAARAFAAMLLAGPGAEAGQVGEDGEAGEEAARHARLALAEQHPDLRIVEPEGATVRREEAEAMVRHAVRSPIEGSRKVVVGVGFQAVEDVAVGLLLKTVEEPPASTHFVLLSTELSPELATLASRCVTVELRAVPPGVIAARLVAEGADPTRADAIAAAARGDLSRARLLASDERFAARVAAVAEMPSRIDGTGATAAQLAAELAAMVDDAQAALDAAHAAERADLEARVERYGRRGSGRQELEARHKREVRRHRAAELRAALAVLAACYRDCLVDARHPERVVAALARLDAAGVALARYPNEALLLQALFVGLPALPFDGRGAQPHGGTE